jgi:hypothetical protein
VVDVWESGEAFKKFEETLECRLHLQAGGEVYVSDEPDRERVRALIAELDKVRQESERLRAKIAEIRRQSPEFPGERDRSRAAERPIVPPKGDRDSSDYD